MQDRIQGRVAAILNDREVALNVGSVDGVEPGMRFAILSAQPVEIQDPTTGDKLGQVDRAKVRVKVSDAKAKFCIARTYETYFVNVGGTGIDLGQFKLFDPPKYVTRVKTLRADEEDMPAELDELDSIVKVNDRAVQLLDEEEEFLTDTLAIEQQSSDRPAFEVTPVAVKRTLTEFTPEFGLRQASGRTLPQIQWRFRGPAKLSDWNRLTSSNMARAKLTKSFDLTSSAGERDEHVGADELGIEIRFHTGTGWRSELHRWPLIKTEKSRKTLVDFGPEILPPLYFDSSDSAPTN